MFAAIGVQSQLVFAIIVSVVGFMIAVFGYSSASSANEKIDSFARENNPDYRLVNLRIKVDYMQRDLARIDSIQQAHLDRADLVVVKGTIIADVRSGIGKKHLEQQRDLGED